MEKKKTFHEAIEEIYREDPRYKPDAYEFLMQALHFTQKKLKRVGHVSGKELVSGIRDFAIDQYGPMAKTVLNHWGIAKTQDFGAIVFIMIRKKVLSQNDTDTLEEFNDVYSFDEAFDNVLRDIVIKDR